MHVKYPCVCSDILVFSGGDHRDASLYKRQGMCMAKSVPILTVNTGSSSIRLAAYAATTGAGVELLAAQHGEPNHRNPAEHVRRFLRDHGLADIALVAHRVVHGGEKFLQSCLLDDGAERENERPTDRES